MPEGTPIDREKLLSIGVQTGYSRHGKDWTNPVTDEHRNTTTHHWDGRQDVLIRAPRLHASMPITEVRTDE
jgi:hypothetical protein